MPQMLEFTQSIVVLMEGRILQITNAFLGTEMAAPFAGTSPQWRSALRRPARQLPKVEDTTAAGTHK